MKKRTIERGAFLQNYEGIPERLLGEFAEVARKGYRSVFLAAMEELGQTRALCARAHELGMEVGLFTGYMKYDYKYLAEHPDQQMVFAEKENDQDGIGMTGWGCPFNPELKARYFIRLQEIAAFPGVTHISLNDEGFLGSGCYCAVCRQAFADEIGGPMPRKPHPAPEDWKDPQWRKYLAWKLRRWSAVHREMAEVVRRGNPRVRVSFQASPAVDLWMNPWFSGVDLADMAEFLDIVTTDPYYTFHQRLFDPAEVYLSEWSRFLYGITPEGKDVGIIPQGFSHPVFTRPLGADDGIWSAVVPPACGATMVFPYTYTLQRSSPVLAAYEDCFRIDPWFERTTPLKYAGLVHGLKTEVFKHGLPMSVPGSYDGTRLLAVATSLRHSGIPYGYLPDTSLKSVPKLSGFDVIVMPEIACTDAAEREGFSRFIRDGANAVILGDLGSAGPTGDDAASSLLDELFGIRTGPCTPAPRQFRLRAAHPAAAGLQYPDPEAARRYMDGAMAPLLALSHCRDAEIPSDAEVLADFLDAAGEPTGKPAIVSLARHGGRVIWYAGFPTRNVRNDRYGTTVLNMAHPLFANFTQWSAGRKPALRVEDWPPMVPMRRLRPLDQRFMPTFEFMPLAGEDCVLGVITSYFKEPSAFPMVLAIPPGKRVARVRELLAGKAVPFDVNGGEARIQVELTFDTPALVFLFELE